MRSDGAAGNNGKKELESKYKQEGGPVREEMTKGGGKRKKWKEGLVIGITKITRVGPHTKERRDS